RRSDAASNRDFEPGFEGPSGVRSLDLHVLRVPPPVSPCYGELSPCYGEIISLLPSCSSCTANFPQAIVIKMNFPAKTGPETANSPCFLPVIRENQGAKPLSNPSLMLPSCFLGFPWSFLVWLGFGLEGFGPRRALRSRTPSSATGTRRARSPSPANAGRRS